MLNSKELLYGVGLWVFIVNALNSGIITVYLIRKASKDKTVAGMLFFIIQAILTGIMVILAAMPLALLNNPAKKLGLDTFLVILGLAYAIMTSYFVYLIYKNGGDKYEKVN